MKKSLTILVVALSIAIHLQTHVKSDAGNWKTWFSASGKICRISAPASYKEEIPEVLSRQKDLDCTGVYTRASFELGKSTAEKEIERIKHFMTKTTWDRKLSDQTGFSKGKNPMFPLAGLNKTLVLESSMQFHPASLPDFINPFCHWHLY